MSLLFVIITQLSTFSDYLLHINQCILIYYIVNLVNLYFVNLLWFIMIEATPFNTITSCITFMYLCTRNGLHLLMSVYAATTPVPGLPLRTCMYFRCDISCQHVHRAQCCSVHRPASAPPTPAAMVVLSTAPPSPSAASSTMSSPPRAAHASATNHVCFAQLLRTCCVVAGFLLLPYRSTVSQRLQGGQRQLPVQHRVNVCKHQLQLIQQWRWHYLFLPPSVLWLCMCTERLGFYTDVQQLFTVFLLVTTTLPTTTTKHTSTSTKPFHWSTD